MTHYTIGLRHSSIGYMPDAKYVGNLNGAKAAGTKMFGAGFVGHNIVILNERDECVAQRRIGKSKWTTVQS